jgi:hypothetical protein
MLDEGEWVLDEGGWMTVNGCWMKNDRGLHKNFELPFEFDICTRFLEFNGEFGI